MVVLIKQRIFVKSGDTSSKVETAYGRISDADYPVLVVNAFTRRSALDHEDDLEVHYVVSFATWETEGW